MALVPDAVLANWATWWPGRVDALVADLAQRWEQAVAAWGVVGARPLPGGEVALVQAARVDTREVVVKLNPAAGDPSFADEAAALTEWARAGLAPEVLATRDGGLTLMMARVRPGGSLRDAGASSDEIAVTIGGLLRRIHVVPEPGRFRSLRVAAADDGWFHALAGTREHDELTRLTEPGRDDRLLHVDLHWLNALRGPDGWLAIDPKPAFGDPHADVFVFFDGPPLRDLDPTPAAAREQLIRRIAAFADAAGLDHDRAAAWVRLRALVALAQSEDGANRRARALARLADALG